MKKFEVYSKFNELLWIVDTEEDAKRLTQGTHHYVIVNLTEYPRSDAE